MLILSTLESCERLTIPYLKCPTLRHLLDIGDPCRARMPHGDKKVQETRA